jgi:hypothetical protein
LYVGVGGLGGIVATCPSVSGSSCLPFLSVFGVIESTCPNATVNIVWVVALGIPRFLMVFPAIPIAVLKAAILNGDRHWLTEGLVWLALSIPIVAGPWVGALYWGRHHRYIAILITPLVLGGMMGVSMRM